MSPGLMALASHQTRRLFSLIRTPPKGRSKLSRAYPPSLREVIGIRIQKVTFDFVVGVCDERGKRTCPGNGTFGASGVSYFHDGRAVVALEAAIRADNPGHAAIGGTVRLERARASNHFPAGAANVLVQIAGGPGGKDVGI